MPLMPFVSSHTHHHHAATQRLAPTAYSPNKSARERHTHCVSARARHGPERAVRRAGGRQDCARVSAVLGSTKVFLSLVTVLLSNGEDTQDMSMEISV